MNGAWKHIVDSFNYYDLELKRHFVQPFEMSHSLSIPT